MNYFTASQIARAMGVTRQAAYRLLLSIAPSGQVIISGAPVNAWAIGALPASARELLEDKARRLGYSTPELLSANAKRWEPKIPLASVTQNVLDLATKLQRALRRSLDAQNDLSIASNEIEAMALEDWRREFGYVVTDRHVRYLIKRTIERDGAEGNWTRMELYLPDRLPRAEVLSLRNEAEFAELSDVISTFAVPNSPTADEKACLWLGVFRSFDGRLSDGQSKKKVRLRLLKFLAKHAPWLASSRNALRVSFDHKYGSWLEKECSAEALRDGRRKKLGERRADPIPQQDLDLLAAHSALNCGGRTAQAARELASMGEKSGLTVDTLALLTRPHASKSYVNQRIAAPVNQDVRLIAPYLLGKKAIDDATASLTRDYSKLRPMTAITADDYTFPVYFYVPDTAGWFILTRGQCLLFIDCRTLKILGYAVRPAHNYDSLMIRSLDNEVCRRWGIPRVKLFERGIWERSKVVKNAAPVPAGWNTGRSWAEHDFGWEQLGVRIIHAKRARTKPAELVGGLVQNLMERMPGYCGRDERRDCPDKTKKDKLAVEAKRLEPFGRFLSFDEWDRELGCIIERYNTAAQEGFILDGASPDKAFETLWPHDDPPSPFEGKHWHLLAHYVSKRNVGVNGISFKIGKERFVYRDKQTGKMRDGGPVLAWFDPQCPELLGVTDLNQQNPVLIPRAQAVGFLATLDDKESSARRGYEEEVGKVAAHNRHAAARFHVLRKTFEPTFRRAIVAPEVAEVGEKFAAERERIAERVKQDKKALSAYRKLEMAVPENAVRRPEAIAAAERLNELMNEEEPT